MGRLFWKFFLAFWLAQAITSLGVGVAIWAWHAEHHLHEQTIPEPLLHLMNDDPPLIHPVGAFPPPLFFLIGSVVSMVFAALLAWYFVRPIRDLRTALDAVAGGRLDVRVGQSMNSRQDELADLGRDFDHMTARLQKLMESKRRLLHNISHELRSPLARIQVATDLIQQQPERAAKLVSRLERDTARIDTLVGELLMLEQLDFGMAGRMDEVVDLQELLDHIADDARFEALPRQCSVTLDLTEPIYVKGRQELLSRAFENVIRNAILHSPTGGHVEIAVRQDYSGSWVITIADEGQGMPPEELENIFEPFFRGKTSSANHTGYGLGLAIARRVVQEHGGSIRATNRPSGGLMVTIALPAEKQA